MQAAVNIFLYANEEERFDSVQSVRLYPCSVSVYLWEQVFMRDIGPASADVSSLTPNIENES